MTHAKSTTSLISAQQGEITAAPNAGYVCDTKAILTETQLQQMANARKDFVELQRLLCGAVIPAIGRLNPISSRLIGLLEAIHGQSGGFLAKECREHFQAHSAREVTHG